MKNRHPTHKRFPFWAFRNMSVDYHIFRNKELLSKLLVMSSPRQILNEGKDLVDSDIDCK